MRILTDYGGVLSTPQTPEDVVALAQISAQEVTQFQSGYWRYRDDYDRGDLSASEYWTAVLGRPVEENLLVELNALDLASWSHPNLETVQTYAQIVADGRELALLSNAPLELARLIETLSWLPRMGLKFFSCDLRLTKPAPEIYRRVTELMDADPTEILFIDDRIENIDAAVDAGMKTIHFADARQLDSLLRPVPS